MAAQDKFKLRVGIPLMGDDPESGGGHSYFHQMVRAIDEYPFDEKIEIFFIHFASGATNQLQNKPQITIIPFATYGVGDVVRKVAIRILNWFGPLFSNLKYRLELRHNLQREKNISASLKNKGINLLLYLKPEGHTYEFPFVTTHWDIGHRSTYMFPEFTLEFSIRENYYRNILPRALTILVESETGKNELLAYTHLNKEKIEVMPLFPGNVITEQTSESRQKEILHDLQLQKNQFILYPAQFWAHKNHVTLIDAFERVHKEIPELKLILTGSDKGNLTYINKYVESSALSNCVYMPGFVSNEVLFTLYQNAICMVMPTFLGPSNMPPLEAAVLGCPLILSDLEGHKELMGDYADYFDPTDSEELSKLILKRVRSNPSKKIFTNKEKFSIGTAMKSLEHSLLKLMPIRKTWG